MIVVTSDPERKLVRVVMSGMLTVEEVMQFSYDERAAVAAMGLRSGEFVLLVEALGNLVQTQEVTKTFEELIVNSPCKSRKIATVRDGVLTRMQTRRILGRHAHAAMFDNVADAEAWLFGDAEPASADFSAPPPPPPAPAAAQPPRHGSPAPSPALRTHPPSAN